MYEETELRSFCNRLKFPDALEAQFRSDYDQRAVPATRIALIVGLVLYAAFGILDFWGIPGEKHLAWLVRYAFVCPSFTAAFLFTFLPSSRGALQPVMSVVSFVAGLGIVIMIGVSHPSEPAYTRYCVGLLLVVMFTYTFLRLRLQWAVLSSLLVLAAYEITAVFWQHILLTRDGTLAFIHNNLFLVSANVLGSTAGYSLESFARRDFFQRRTIEAELASAREVQASFLPREFPVLPEISIAGDCRPARQVGGDYFDFLPAGPGLWFLIIADVSGKGAPAALLMANLHALIRTLPLLSAPGKLGSAINSHVYGLANESKYVTAILAVLNIPDLRLTYVNAGHCGGMVIDRDGIERALEPTGFPLGLFQGSEYEEGTIQLQPGSTVLLFTDGISERENPAGQAFGKEGLLQSALLHDRSRPSTLLDQAFRRADQFADNLEPADDATVLIVQVNQNAHQIYPEFARAVSTSHDATVPMTQDLGPIWVQSLPKTRNKKQNDAEPT